MNKKSPSHTFPKMDLIKKDIRDIKPITIPFTLLKYALSHNTINRLQRLLSSTCRKEILPIITRYKLFYEKEGISFLLDSENTLLEILLSSNDGIYYQYNGELPYNLKFSQIRKEVEIILGAPDELDSSTKYISAYYKKKRMIIQYKSPDVKNMRALIATIKLYSKNYVSSRELYDYILQPKTESIDR